MGGAQKAGIVAIILGVLILVMGLAFSDLVVGSVTKQGQRIGCYDANELLIRGASYGIGHASKATTAGLPSRVGATFQGSLVEGRECFVGGTIDADGNTTVVANGALSTVAFDTEPTKKGTIRYDLEVYGADSLNNMFTLIYWIMLVIISLGSVAGGVYGVSRTG